MRATLLASATAVSLNLYVAALRASNSVGPDAQMRRHVPLRWTQRRAGPDHQAACASSGRPSW